MRLRTWLTVLALAAVVGVGIGLALPKSADAVVAPGQHAHGSTVHTHGPADDALVRAYTMARGSAPDLPASYRLMHDDPNRPDESHDPQAPAMDGTYTIRYPDGTVMQIQVMGGLAFYDGRMLEWDEHGGGWWRDPEDPNFGLAMRDPNPPEQPDGWAWEIDKSGPTSTWTQHGGPGYY